MASVWDAREGGGAEGEKARGWLKAVSRGRFVQDRLRSVMASLSFSARV